MLALKQSFFYNKIVFLRENFCKLKESTIKLFIARQNAKKFEYFVSYINHIIYDKTFFCLGGNLDNSVRI